MEYRAKTFSIDGTIKYLFDVTGIDILSGGKRELSIESAFIEIPNRADEKPKYALCLSSQKGCVYACLMCANMREGYYGNLTAPELNEQINLVLEQDGNLEKILRAGSVEYAFMGHGEPLFGNQVIKAIIEHKGKVKDTRFALSTLGLPGTIRKLTKHELPYPLRLELSLHFSNDKLRNKWLVQNSFVNQLPKLNIKQALDEAEEFMEKFRGKVTLNYALIDGINNTDSNLQEIASLLEGRTGFYVKVMKPNLTSSLVYSWTGGSLGCSKDTRTYNPEEFGNKLLELGIEATYFESKGTDIFAGCGMMRVRFGREKGVFVTENTPEADPTKIGLD